MQAKTQSKSSKLHHYFSVKDYQQLKDKKKQKEKEKDTSKKPTKLNNQKSNIKNQKITKNQTNKSNSKNKHTKKQPKNNQNFNSININGHETSRPKTLFQTYQITTTKDKQKQKDKGDRTKRNSNERMVRSKSAGRINVKVERRTMSPSPIGIKETPHFLHEDKEKIKITKNHTSRSEKQKKMVITKSKEDVVVAKLKKSGSKLTITTSKNQILDKPMASNRTSNRISVKTEISSKTHSVMREENKTKKQPKKLKQNSKKLKKQQQKQMKYHKNLPPTKSKFQSQIQKSILYSQVSFQDCNGQCPYQSAIISNQKYFLPYPQQQKRKKNVKTQGCQTEPKQEYRLNFRGMNQAAIKIQKLFRGYITRKYIDQAKFIISKVKIIQTWWRKARNTKPGSQQQLQNQQNNNNNPKNLLSSSSNSLITIKDFNDTLPKPQRSKANPNAPLPFPSSSSSSPSEQQLPSSSNTKIINMKELIKNILQQNQQSSSSSINQSQSKSQSNNHTNNLNTLNNNNLRQLLSNTPSNYKNKQQYIEVKIKDEILSQRKFNSPKNNSPCSFINTPTNICFNIKEYFSSSLINSNEKNKIKEIIQSPKLASPSSLKSPRPNSPLSQSQPNSHSQLNSQSHSLQNSLTINPPPYYQCTFKLSTETQTYQPFQTNFTAIQQICLYLVDYFKVKQTQMQSFIKRLINLKYFKTTLVFKYWNSYKIYSQENDQVSQTFPPPDYQYMQNYQKPNLFPEELRADIIKFPEIEIELNNKRFNLDNKVMEKINRSFLQFIFDALQQAFYQPYRYSGLKYGESLEKNIYKSKKDLFQRYLCSALGHLFSWGEVLCGLMPDIYSEQEKIKEERMSIFEKRLEYWDLGVSSRLGIKMQIAFLIFEELIEEMQEQMRLL